MKAQLHFKRQVEMIMHYDASIIVDVPDGTTNEEIKSYSEDVLAKDSDLLDGLDWERNCDSRDGFDYFDYVETDDVDPDTEPLLSLVRNAGGALVQVTESEAK